MFMNGCEERSPLRVGCRFDKFRILRRLGEGGFATVYAAHDVLEDRKVALKVPDSGYLQINIGSP